MNETKNEALNKIGRNMLLFQQLESLLKFVVANGSFSGYTSSLNEDYENTSPVKRQTMGQLVGQYIEYTNPGNKGKSSDSDNLSEGNISFNVHIGTGLNYYEAKKKVMEQIVSERNVLIHNMLPMFDPDSEESCMMLQEKLDRQGEKISSEIKEVEIIANAIKDGRKKIADFLRSAQGEGRFDLFHRLSRIGFLLVDIAARIKRADGWASMSTAGQLLKKHAPEEFDLLKREDEYNSLKKIILATGLFDLCEEKTGSDGCLFLYRLRQVGELSHP